MNYLKKIYLVVCKYKWHILSTIPFFVLGYFYHNDIFALHFVDEEDNFVLGKFLFENQKLYSDLFSHHQPLGYVISGFLQYLLDLPNIFMLVKRHREFMILYSLLWSVVLLFRFNIRFFIPLFIFELSKFFLLGQLFLSESLVVYPLIYLTVLLFEKSKKISSYELFLVGFLISFSGFLLLPLWPYLFIYMCVLLWIKSISIRSFLLVVLGGIIPLLISLPFVDLYFYFHNVFYINTHYYIPLGTDEKQPMALLKGFLTPFTALTLPVRFVNHLVIIQSVAVLFFIGLGILVRLKRYRECIVILFLLTLANFRYVDPSQDYYRGFHLLPWYGIFIFLTFHIFIEVRDAVHFKVLKKLLFFLPILLLLPTIIVSRSLFTSNDINQDYYVNYSRQYTFGEAIRIMKNDSDRLFVIPDEWLIYWQGDVRNANKMVNLYPWMEKVPELSGYVTETFNTNPPTFFYCDCTEEKVFYYTKQTDYRQLEKDGGKTSLWVLESKLENLNSEQKKQLVFHNFAI